MSKRKSPAPRNPFVAAARERKAGRHGKTEKALRRAARMEMQAKGFVAQLAEQGAFTSEVVGSNPTGSTTLHNESGSRNGLFPLCSSPIVQR